MKKYFKYIAVLLSFVMVFSLSGFAALQTLTNVFAADSPSAGDNSGTGSDSPSAGDNTGDNTGSDSPSAGDNSDDGNGSGELQSGDWKYTINEDGTVKLTKFTAGGSTFVSIPSQINGRQVTIIGENALKNANFGPKFEIPEGIKKLENAAIVNGAMSVIVVPKSLEEVEGNPIQSTSNFKVYGYNGSVLEDVINDGPYGVFYCLDYDYPETDDYVYRINKDDTVTIVEYKGNAEAVEVPAAIDGKKVTKIGNFSFVAKSYQGSNISNIVSVKLPDGITKIGTGAFENCYKLEKVEMPDSITEIGEYAFYSCYSLCDVTIPKGVSRIEKYAFYSYSSLRNNVLSVTIHPGVNYISKYAFGDNSEYCNINGYTNSYAEEFAKENNIKFNSLGVYEEPTEPENPSETPSETPSKPETPIDNDVLDSINNGEKVVTKEVEAGNGSVVPTDFVAAAIEKGAQLVLEVKGTDGNPLVKYTFNGSRFTKAPDANFKLDVTCGEKNEVTDKVKGQLNVTGDDSLFLCNFEHSGELNGELDVTVYPNYDNGTELKLFYYNEATGEAEDMGQIVKVVNGEVTFTVTHFSSYLLVKTADIVTPSEPETTEPGNTPSEPETTNPETTPSETQPETTPSQPETEEVQPESGSYVAPSTGAGTGSAAALVGVMLMACGAAGVCIVKRRK